MRYSDELISEQQCLHNYIKLNLRIITRINVQYDLVLCSSLKVLSHLLHLPVQVVCCYGVPFLPHAHTDHHAKPADCTDVRHLCQGTDER